MSHALKRLTTLSVVGLSACALMPVPNAPATQTISINDQKYLLTRITESTWTARTSGSAKTLNAGPANTAALRLAVEQASGCNVTDSDYSSEGRQFDAQVLCDSKLGN